MKILIYSIYGDGIALYKPLIEEGNQVDIYILSPNAKESYKGMANVVSKPNFLRYNLVLFDMVGQGKLADKLGSRSWGASKFMDTIELDRRKGIEFMKKCGIEVPPYFYFKNTQQAISFLKKEKELYVLKPLGNKDTSLTYVPLQSNNEVVDRILKYKNEIGDLILQQKISGVELSTEAWFYKGKLIDGSINNTLENKKFLPGDLGANTGCMSSLVWASHQPTIIDLVKKIEHKLPRNYTGPLDLNAIWVGRTPYGLEWTARLGYSAIFALTEILGSKLSDAFMGESMKLKEGFGYSTRLTIPPYPVEFASASLNRKLYSINKNEPIVFDEDDSKHIWLLDAKKEKGKFVVAGVDGVVAEVTGYTKELEEKPKSLENIISNFVIPNLQYRNDFFIKQAEKYNKLKKFELV